MTLRLNGSTSGFTEIDAPAVAGSNTLVLPTGNGTSGQVLSTNGSGALSWIGAGKILQVASANRIGEISTTSTSFTDIGLSVSITPLASTSKVFVLYTGSVGNDGNQQSYLTLIRNSTNLGNGNQGFIRIWFNSSTNYNFGGFSMSYLDSPATTASTTYKVQFRTASGTVFASSGNSTDTLTVMEVAA